MSAIPHDFPPDVLSLTSHEFRTHLLGPKQISEFALESLFLSLAPILSREPNVLYLTSPLTICGDIHGQLQDLFRLFETAGEPNNSSNRYLFLGDYVDRGHYSLETFAYLSYFKIKQPSHFFLLRGNHEFREVNMSYGLQQECLELYGHSGLWHLINSVFDLLPFAAVVDNRIFCCHGGLSPTITFISQILTINRSREIMSWNLTPLEKYGMDDLTWSEAKDKGSTFVRPRHGRGTLFGPEQTRIFIHNNNLGRIKGNSQPTDPDHGFVARGHEFTKEGYVWRHGQKLLTIFSAPNYCYREGNLAAVMNVREGKGVDFVVFDKDPNSHIQPDNSVISYFA